MKQLLQLLLICLFPMVAISQTLGEKQVITKDYNKDKLEEMASSFQLKSELEKAEALELAKQNEWPVRYEEDGRLFELMKVSLEGKPLYYSTFNINAAKSTRANTLHNGAILGLNVEGQNMEAHIWDAGLARSSHQEYDGIGGNNRFSIGDGSSALHYHSAHVTGTIIASGFVASAKGMAPQADAIGYEWTNDVSEATTAANGGMLLSNHSYGWDITYVDDWQFGAYASDSRDWDVVMYNAPYYLMVVAAGNEGNNNTANGQPLDGNSSYDKLNGHATTKNNLVVANAQDANIDANGNLISVSINSGSSEGPCDDYRIKPDITGNGTSLYSTYEGSDSEYASISGTSMASPNVTGTLLLLQQHYNNLNSGFMRAATLKGLALHTADDAGPSGPDAVWGWGLLNGKEAANTISTNGAESTISELSLNNGGSYSINVDSDGVNDLIASISWTDPAGTANSGTVNLTTPVLVNDLDIRVTKGGSTYYPYRLTSITTNSNSGDNNVDPYEKVIISGASGSYTITITHKGSLSSGSQDYTLIVTGKADAPSFPVANFMADDVTPSVGQTVSFTDLSSGVPTSWSWAFNPSTVTYVGGTSSSSQYPQVTFDAAGSYTVTLTATNSFGSDTEIKTAYIDATVSSSVTYTSGDIPTDFGFQSLPGASTCPGTLTVNIPAGAIITGVDVDYDMTAISSENAWKSEQRSQLRCVSTGGASEATLYSGSGDVAGTQSYSRTGLSIANGVTGGGNINFELHAGRAWGGSGCNTTINKVDNNTWTVTVYFTPASLPPVTDFSADDTTPAIGQTVTLTDASLNSPTSWTWSFSPSTVTYINSTSTSSQNPQVTFDAAGLYTVSLTATNASGSDNMTKTDYIDVPLSYCNASGGATFLHISRVQLGTIDNSSAQDFYSDYTSQSTNITLNQQYSITITNGDPYDLNDLGIWIDWNQNGNLNDAGDNIVCDIDNWGQGSFNFTVPGTALQGITLMRIRTKYNGSDCGSPCGTTAYGEVEDYSVNITVGVPGLWTGSISTDWNNAVNWDDSNIPVAASDISIPTSPTGGNFPETNSGTGAECANLTIETGAHLFIPSNNTLTVTGTLTNNGGNTGLILKSDASGTGSLINNTTGVNATVERYLIDGRWHFIGMPVSSSLVDVFHLPGGHSDIYLRTHIEATNLWDAYIVPLGTPLALGRGYETWVGDPAGFSQPETIEFFGTLNTGDFTTGSGGFYGLSFHTGHGLNLIANPYPSALQGNIDTWTKTNVANSIWTWSKTYGNYVYWGSGSDYSWGTPAFGTMTGGVIPAMQGFFVEARRANPPPYIIIPQSDRIHSSQAYYKETEIPANTMQLEVNANDYKDAIFVTFNEQATDDYDGQDVRKLFGLEDAPQLYSMITDNQLSINALPELTGYRTVQLGFECGLPGDCSFSASDIESFNGSVSVYLEDTKEGTMQDLTSNPIYSFTYGLSDELNRFVLHFGNPNGINEGTLSTISIYSNGDMVYVQRPQGFDGIVTIFDMLGQEIDSQTAIGKGLISIPVKSGTGYYFVKVQSDGQLVTEKVFIK